MVDSSFIKIDLQKVVLRLQNFSYLDRSLAASGASGEELEEVIAFVGADTALDTLFQARSGTPTPFGTGRFGDGSYPVMYTAFELATCVAELRFHFPQRGIEDALFHVISVTLRANAFDLRDEVEKYPYLIQEEHPYTECRSLGKELRSEGADALVSLSARHASGTTVPIFTRQSVADMRVLDRISLRSGASVSAAPPSVQ